MMSVFRIFLSNKSGLSWVLIFSFIPRLSPPASFSIWRHVSTLLSWLRTYEYFFCGGWRRWRYFWDLFYLWNRNGWNCVYFLYLSLILAHCQSVVSSIWSSSRVIPDSDCNCDLFPWEDCPAKARSSTFPDNSSNFLGQFQFCSNVVWFWSFC